MSEREKELRNLLDEVKNLKEGVVHPKHYESEIEPWDAIKVWGLDFDLGNAVKYIVRAGNKENESKQKDLQKALNYIQHELKYLED